MLIPDYIACYKDLKVACLWKGVFKSVQTAVYAPKERQNAGLVYVMILSTPLPCHCHTTPSRHGRTGNQRSR